MNIFRFFGDMSHILSFIILLHKIVKGKSAAGISLRTQECASACAAPRGLSRRLPAPRADVACRSPAAAQTLPPGLRQPLH
jgi:hypothetical protein